MRTEIHRGREPPSWALAVLALVAGCAFLAGCRASDQLFEVRDGDGGLRVDAGSVQPPTLDVAASDGSPGADGAPADADDWIPGVSPCGPAGDRCQGTATCSYCNAGGARLACTCSPAGTWECASTDGACGVACGTRNCLPDEVCRALDVACGLRNVPPLPLLYECVPRPSSCTSATACACLQPRGCPVTAFFCHDGADPRAIECRCRS